MGKLADFYKLKPKFGTNAKEEQWQELSLIMYWKRLFGKKEEVTSQNKGNSYPIVELGEKLPWPQYQKTGDYSTILLTPTGFSIIISLTNLSKQEQKAIGDQEFQMYLTPADCIPFLIVKFGEVFKTDLTINLMGLTADKYNNWIHAKNNTVELYLLEGSDATLKCIRYFDYPHMDMLRRICEGQINHSAEAIKSGITQVYNNYSVEALIASARCVDIIPEVKYHL